MKSRLHLYPHRGPNSKAYIVAEPAALRALAKALNHAANSVAGLETVALYGSDGHEYELVIVSDVSEDEWQKLPLPDNTDSAPKSLTTVKFYDEIVAATKASNASS